MSDTRERNLYIVEQNNALYVHTVSKAALQRIEAHGGTLTVIKDGADIRDNYTGQQE